MKYIYFIIGLIIVSLFGRASADDIGFGDIAKVDVVNVLSLVSSELGWVFSVLLAAVLVVVVVCVVVLIIKGAGGEIIGHIETRSRAFMGIVTILGLLIVGSIALVLLFSMFNKFYLS